MSATTPVNQLHQILILDGGALPEALPPALADNVRAARAAYPEAQYRLWSQAMLRGFLGETYAPEVLWAFDKLQPYSYKSDLARFCLLHHFGGLYVDLGVRIAERWDFAPECGFAAFRDVPFVTRSWSAMQTGLIWAKPGRKELRKAIDFIVENCRNEYYGGNPLYPTGPVVFGRACIAAMAEGGQYVEDQYVGECRCLTPDSEMLNLTYVSRGGIVVALRTKRTGGDLRHMGLERTNNYNEMWRCRQAYGESARRWLGGDPVLEFQGGAERTERGIRVGEGVSGRVIYGPYVHLDAGAYRLRVAFAAESEPDDLQIEICALFGKSILFHFDATAASRVERGVHEFSFVLNEPQREVEFRVATSGAFRGTIEYIELQDEPTRTWSHSDPRIGVLEAPRTDRGVEIARGVSGRVIYGPYATLKPGSYRLDIAFAPGVDFSRLRVEVGCDRGSTLLETRDIGRDSARREPRVAIEFDIARVIADAEFRLEVFGDFDGVFQSYTLTQLSQGVPFPAPPRKDSLRAAV